MAGGLKARVRRAFGKARDYDANAWIQAQAALSLAERIAGAGLGPQARVFEIGCGTGALTRRIADRVRLGGLVCADLSPDMLARARVNLADLSPPPLFAAMDAEFPAVSPVFDAVVSSMALQWATDLRATLDGLWRLVRPGGLMAVCLPGRGTFASWIAAHQACGLTCGLLEFPCESDLAAMLPPGARIFQEDKPMVFARARDFPRHLKEIGAAVPRPGFTPLRPDQFRAVLTELDRTYPGGPVVAYRLLYALAVKHA